MSHFVEGIGFVCFFSSLKYMVDNPVASAMKVLVDIFELISYGLHPLLKLPLLSIELSQLDS